MADLISPVAIGIISDPPTIVISYDCIGKNGGGRRRRKRKMPLRDFTDRSNVKRYAFNLRQRHTNYLANVIDVTLEKMLRIIQEIQKGNSVEKSLTIVNKEYIIDPDEDLNKLSPAILAQRKAIMDEEFHKNLVKPGDPDFVYDREITFDVKEERNGDNDWDEDSDKGTKKVDTPLVAPLDNDEGPATEEPREDYFKPKTANKEISLNFSFPTSPDPDPDPLISIEIPADTAAGVTSDFKLDHLPTKKNVSDDNDSGDSMKVVNLNGSQMNLPSQDIKNVSTTPETKVKIDDESSSTNDIEEALVQIESGVLDEDEDFWQ